MSIESVIGNTPLVPLTRLNPHHARVRVLAKLEGNNPGGSVKDRPAWYMRDLRNLSVIPDDSQFHKNELC